MEIPAPTVTHQQNIDTTSPIPYDNDVTLLYKWAEIFQVPIQLIVVRPRTPEDAAITSGTETYVFESLLIILDRLIKQGETPSAIYDIITTHNKLITVDDIIMVYFDYLRRNDPSPDIYLTINEIYRNMDNTLTLDKFEDFGDLEKSYNAWVTTIFSQYERDMKRLDTIKDIQLALAEVDQGPSIPFSPVSVNSTITSFSPTINGRPVTVDDGLDIFNSSVTSKYIPYIRYNDKYGRPYFRVYSGDKAGQEPNYSITIIPSANADNKNTIYMTLWLGDPSNDGSVQITSASKESFFTVVYHLDTNYLTVESPVGSDPRRGLIRNEHIAYARTKSGLPTLDFGQGKEVKVRGDFNMWGLDFDETSFLDMVLLEPLMNVYLYVEENIRPYAFKKRLDVHYRSIYSDMAEGKTVTDDAYISNSASVSITLSQKQSINDEVISIANPVTKEVTQANLLAGTQYITVNITQAESRDVVNAFIPIFQLLMKFYMQNRQPIIDVYNLLLPELQALKPLLEQRKHKSTTHETGVLELAKKKAVNRRTNSKIKQLQEHGKELFSYNYARVCQQVFQPTIIQENEVEAWKQRRFGPAQRERQVMPFPKDNPEYYLVCPDDDHPYPGVKVNKYFNNREEYPYLPCCYKSDHMTPGVNSHYRDYIEGTNRKASKGAKGAKADTKIKTPKILLPGKVAYLARAIWSVVKQYSDEYVDMVRYGTIYTHNSLLHCVCEAVDDPNYLTLRSEEEKEEYVSRLRQHMMGQITPALLKQELYDYTDEEIIRVFTDNDVVFDPMLFYRAVEEVFNINLYVFTPSTTNTGETELGSIDIPRFKIFHSRPLRLHRPTVVISKTWGSESDTLEFPHCELIVDYDKDNREIVKLFGPEMTEICHNALQETLKTMTWTVNPNDNTFDVHSNIYYYINHVSLFQLPPVSQYIDTNGKMRSLTMNIGNGNLMTVATIPSQPENLPIDNTMHPVSLEIALEIFGDPTAVTRDANGDLSGLWFQIMDIVHGEYVSIIPTKGLDDKPLGPPNPIVSSGVSVTGRLSKLRRTLNIIRQIVRWLYELARAKQPIDPNSFATQYMVMDQDPVEDSANYYKLDNIPRRLPVVETAADAIRALEPLAPTLFNNGHIVMYSANFANRIIKMLKDYSTLKYGMPPQHIEFLEDYYETESDFTQVPNSKVFISEKDLNSWLDSLKSSQHYSQYFNIRRKVEIGLGFSPDPYMYQDDNGKIYIIQNVLGGAKSKALAVSKTWHDFKVNVGFEPASLNETPLHLVYGISSASVLVPVEDQTYDHPNYYKILYYGTPTDKAIGKDGRYAAMLEIL